MKMHWWFLVLYLVFAALLMFTVMWLVAFNSGSFGLTLVVGLLLCYALPVGFALCDLAAHYAHQRRRR